MPAGRTGACTWQPTSRARPYLFPNNNRRRSPGYLYLSLGAIVIGVWALTQADDPAWMNEGVLLGGVLLALVGAYHLLSGCDLDIDEQDALVAATRAVGFPVGHASAQMGWRVRSRPTWRILLYSDETPPTTRGLVLVDGVDGTVVEHFVETNPRGPDRRSPRVGQPVKEGSAAAGSAAAGGVVVVVVGSSWAGATTFTVTGS